MKSILLESIINDESLVSEIQQKLVNSNLQSARFDLSEFIQPSLDGFEAIGLKNQDKVAELIRERVSRSGNFEAIVMRFGRPSLIVRNGTFEVPASDTWKARLNPYKSMIDRAINSVGRVEL